MNKSYDSLNRYNCDEETKEIIKKHLSAKEIDYIIDYQIEPEYFVAYLDYPKFNIYHIGDYHLAEPYFYNSNKAQVVDIVERLFKKKINNEETYSQLMGKTYEEIVDIIEDY